jgi:hypothetical protein
MPIAFRRVLFAVLALSALVGLGVASAEPAGARSTAATQLTFASDEGWGVYDADPGAGAATFLGQAARVCLNATSPSPCPIGAVQYGAPGGGWPANLSDIPGAAWIWAPGVGGGTSPAELQQFFFSRVVTLEGPPTAAVILVGADDFAEVRINGAPIASVGSTTDPGASAAAQANLTAFDIAEVLGAGTNTITIRAQNGPAAFTTGCGDHCTYAQNPAGVVFGGTVAGLAEGALTEKAQCKEGGWRHSSGPVFKNQGDCVSFFATGGRNRGDGDADDDRGAAHSRGSGKGHKKPR